MCSLKAPLYHIDFGASVSMNAYISQKKNFTNNNNNNMQMHLQVLL